jgi:hypothetical protein
VPRRLAPWANTRTMHDSSLDTVATSPPTEVRRQVTRLKLTSRCWESRLVMGTRTGSPAACGCVDVQIHSQVVPTQVVACGSGARLHGAADGQFAPSGSTHQLVHAWWDNWCDDCISRLSCLRVPVAIRDACGGNL